MNYIILREMSHVNLEKKVNEYIPEGYSPMGGLTIIKAFQGLEYYQAIIKNK